MSPYIPPNPHSDAFALLAALADPTAAKEHLEKSAKLAADADKAHADARALAADAKAAQAAAEAARDEIRHKLVDQKAALGAKEIEIDRRARELMQKQRDLDNREKTLAAKSKEFDADHSGRTAEIEALEDEIAKRDAKSQADAAAAAALKETWEKKVERARALLDEA